MFRLRWPTVQSPNRSARIRTQSLTVEKQTLIWLILERNQDYRLLIFSVGKSFSRTYWNLCYLHSLPKFDKICILMRIYANYVITILLVVKIKTFSENCGKIKNKRKWKKKNITIIEYENRWPAWISFFSLYISQI